VAALAAVAALGASYPAAFSSPPPPHFIYWPYQSPPLSQTDFYNLVRASACPQILPNAAVMSNVPPAAVSPGLFPLMISQRAPTKSALPKAS
jgi:hypothetical protein